MNKLEKFINLNKEFNELAQANTYVFSKFPGTSVKEIYNIFFKLYTNNFNLIINEEDLNNKILLSNLQNKLNKKDLLFKNKHNIKIQKLEHKKEKVINKFIIKNKKLKDKKFIYETRLTWKNNLKEKNKEAWKNLFLIISYPFCLCINFFKKKERKKI